MYGIHYKSEFMVSAPSTNIFKNRVDNNWRMIWATYKRLTSSLANAQTSLRILYTGMESISQERHRYA